MGTRINGPPVPERAERKPVMAPMQHRAGLEIVVASDILASAPENRDCSPEETVSNPIRISRRAEDVTLAAYAPPNAAGIAPAHSHPTMFHWIDLARA